MEKEILKPIIGFPDYFISNQGCVYSKKKGTLTKLRPFLDGRGLYLMIGLINEFGIRKKLLLHRLVAQAFIPNPNNLPEVNHKDKNTKNPKADNLEWCTRRDNILDSYTTMSPIRNYNSCTLYRQGRLIGNFKSILEASRYASASFGVSKSSLEKYLVCGEFYIIQLKLTRKNTGKPRNKRAS